MNEILFKLLMFFNVNSCEIHCSQVGGVYYLGAGTCLCSTEAGIQNYGALCRMWNPSPEGVKGCNQHEAWSLEQIADERDHGGRK